MSTGPASLSDRDRRFAKPRPGATPLHTTVALLVSLTLAGTLSAQPRDQTLIRGGLVVTNEWDRGGYAMGGAGGIDFSFWLGKRWGLELGGGVASIPLAYRYDNRACPGACPEGNPSPGVMLHMAGGGVLQVSPRVTLLAGIGRTHSPTQADFSNVPHPTVWGVHAGFRAAPWRNPELSPLFEFRITRWEHKLGHVRWLFAPALVMRL